MNASNLPSFYDSWRLDNNEQESQQLKSTKQEKLENNIRCGLEHLCDQDGGEINADALWSNWIHIIDLIEDVEANVIKEALSEDELYNLECFYDDLKSFVNVHHNCEII